MSNDEYDDGLVHSHSWATEPPPPPAGPMRRATVLATYPEEDDGFDDGLVHSHGWACAERGQPSH